MGFAPAGLRFGGVSRLCRLVSCLVFPDVRGGKIGVAERSEQRRCREGDDAVL